MATPQERIETKPITPIPMVREQKPGEMPKLWVKEPLDPSDDLVGARLCSCSDVCLAVMEDR